MGAWSVRGCKRGVQLYRVWYADRSGEAFTCLAVMTILAGFTIEEIW